MVEVTFICGGICEEDQLSRNLWKKINQSFRGIVLEVCCEIMKIKACGRTILYNDRGSTCRSFVLKGL